MENYDPNDFNPYENPENKQPDDFFPYGQIPVRRMNPVNYFETAAWILGIAGIVSCLTFYGAYICGALAAMFALLSRGGQMTMSPKAKRGFVLGILAIVLTTVLFIAAFYIAIDMYGSIEGILREYCEIYGYEFEELFGEMFTQYQQ